MFSNAFACVLAACGLLASAGATVVPCQDGNSWKAEFTSRFQMQTTGWVFDWSDTVDFGTTQMCGLSNSLTKNQYCGWRHLTERGTLTMTMQRAGSLALNIANPFTLGSGTVWVNLNGVRKATLRSPSETTVNMDFKIGDRLIITEDHAIILIKSLTFQCKDSTTVAPTTVDNKLITSLQKQLKDLRGTLASGDKATAELIQMEVVALEKALETAAAQQKASRLIIKANSDLLATNGVKMQAQVANTEGALSELELLKGKVEAQATEMAAMKVLLTKLLSTPTPTPAAAARGSKEPSVASDGADMSLVATRGAVMFESAQCTKTDLCALAQDVAAIKAKFGDA